MNPGKTSSACAPRISSTSKGCSLTACERALPCPARVASPNKVIADQSGNETGQPGRGGLMSSFIERFAPFGPGTKLAVKDVIDMSGVITTAGSKAVAEAGVVAGADASCLAGARAANVLIVGKTNLHEFALGTT